MRYPLFCCHHFFCRGARLFFRRRFHHRGRGSPRPVSCRGNRIARTDLGSRHRCTGGSRARGAPRRTGQPGFQPAPTPRALVSSATRGRAKQYYPTESRVWPDGMQMRADHRGGDSGRPARQSSGTYSGRGQTAHPRRHGTLSGRFLPADRIQYADADFRVPCAAGHQKRRRILYHHRR